MLSGVLVVELLARKRRNFLKRRGNGSSITASRYSVRHILLSYTALLCIYSMSSACVPILFDGCTGYNEKLRKAVKAAYEATNKRREQLVEQLLVNHKVADFFLEEAEHPMTADPDATLANTGRRSRPLRFSRRCTAAQLARNRTMPELCTFVDMESSETLYYCDTVYYGTPSSPRRFRVANTIQAAPSFHAAPAYDWIHYTGPGGSQYYGQAARDVQSRAVRRKRLVVRRAEEGASHEVCVLTDNGCQRLRSAVPSGGDAARLDVVHVKDIVGWVGWVAVEHDWKDLCEQHGLLFMPDEVRSTGVELRATRFFVTAKIAVSNAEADTDDE